MYKILRGEELTRYFFIQYTENNQRGFFQYSIFEFNIPNIFYWLTPFLHIKCEWDQSSYYYYSRFSYDREFEQFQENVSKKIEKKLNKKRKNKLSMCRIEILGWAWFIKKPSGVGGKFSDFALGKYGLDKNSCDYDSRVKEIDDRIERQERKKI